MNFRRLVGVLAAVLTVGGCGGEVTNARVAASARAAARPGPAPSLSSTVVVGVVDAASSADTSDDAEIAAACERYIALVTKLSPEYATALGLHAHDDTLDDRTVEGIEASRAERSKFLAEVEARFATVHASTPARTDLALLLGTLRADLALEAAQQPHLRKPEYYTQLMNAFFLMSARDYAPKEQRATAMLARLAGVPAVVKAAKANLQSPPELWTLVGIDQAKAAPQFFESQRAFLEGALPNERPKIAQALQLAKASYLDYADWLKKVVLPRSNGSFRLGKIAFEAQLKSRYALNESADEVLALGERIFADTERKMNELALKMDPKAKSFAAVIAKLKSNHPKAEDLLSEYRKEVLRARDYLVAKNAIAFPPGDDLEVVDTPLFMRSTISAAYDQPPPFDPGTKGFFFVTPIDLKSSKAEQEQMLRENDHGDIVDTAVHEAYPGHHLQLSFARMHPSRMRKVTDAAIFSEGWALYSEELMHELGYYTDEERMLQLEWALVRAARIVIDVGLHTKSMSYTEAVSLLTNRVRLERPLALSEVKRYTGNPTQPLAYMVGREKLMQLRETYKAREGQAYTLKRFHQEVLAHGTLAPGYLEREMFEH
jgi:uncharacterized protein (DUF885 family)